MLQTFSWGHFLIAMIVLNLVWYGFVVWVFFRSEVMGFLGRGGSAGIGADGVERSAFASDLSEEKGITAKRGTVESDSLMGAARLPSGVEVLSSSQVAFASDDLGRLDGDEQPSLVSDVLQELKVIFSELARTDGDKRTFFRLLAQLKEEFGPLSGHPSIGVINEFIVSHAGFHLSVEELENLWF